MRKIPEHQHKVGWIGFHTGCEICGLLADSIIVTRAPEIVVKRWTNTKIKNWRDKI